MNVARPFRIIATIATLVAVAFGMGTYTHADFTTLHMVFGLIVALALLILAVIASNRRQREHYQGFGPLSPLHI